MVDVLFFGGPFDDAVEPYDSPMSVLDFPVEGAEPRDDVVAETGRPFVTSDGVPCDAFGREVYRYVLRRHPSGVFRYVYHALDRHTSPGEQPAEA